MSFSHLPIEIKLLVASYLPKSQLFRLRFLNSFFLNHWMDTAWKQVVIDTQFPTRAVLLILRLVDPFVAPRVKALSLHIFIDLTKSVSEDVGEWLAELLNTNIQFPSLQSLLLYSSSSQIGQSALLTLVQRTIPTLSSLTIPYRYLTTEEVNQLLDVLTGGGVLGQTMRTATGLIRNERRSKLKALNMSIFQLSVPFLELLALKLPQLESLKLVVSEIVGSGQDSFYDLLHRRRYNRWRDTTSSGDYASQDILHNWKLRHLSIRKWDQMNGAMRAVAGAVPSVLLSN